MYRKVYKLARDYVGIVLDFFIRRKITLLRENYELEERLIESKREREDAETSYESAKISINELKGENIDLANESRKRKREVEESAKKNKDLENIIRNLMGEKEFTFTVSTIPGLINSPSLSQIPALYISEGRVLYSNEKADELFGEKIVGKQPEELGIDKQWIGGGPFDSAGEGGKELGRLYFHMATFIDEILFDGGYMRRALQKGDTLPIKVPSKKGLLATALGSVYSLFTR